MTQRRPRDESVACIQHAVHVADDGARDHRPLADQRALGQACRTAGVQDNQAFFRIKIDAAACFVAAGRFQHFFIFRFDMDDDFHAMCDAGQYIRIACRHEDRARRHQPYAVFQLAVRLPPVLAGQDHAQLGDRQLQLYVFKPVFRQNGDAVAALDTACAQRIRQPVDAFIQFAVAEAASFIFQCGLVPGPLYLLAE